MSLDLSMLCLSTRSTVRKEASVKAKNQPVWYMGRIPHTHCQDEKGSVEYTSELFLYFTEKKNGKRQKEERREIRSHERCRESVWAKRGC